MQFTLGHPAHTGLRVSGRTTVRTLHSGTTFQLALQDAHLWKLNLVEPPRVPATEWVRVSQRYAGRGLGTQFIPRIGQEVLVNFLNDDLDQPIVVMPLYNGRGEGGVPRTPGVPVRVDFGARTNSGAPFRIPPRAPALSLARCRQGGSRKQRRPRLDDAPRTAA